MALDQITRLRTLLGEPIPPSGADTDTMFTDAQVQDFLDLTGTLTQAAYVGWLAKAGTYAGLANTTEGNASRAMSDLHVAALKQVKLYKGELAPAVAGRARVGRIFRPGTGSI